MELARKLHAKGFDETLVAVVVADLGEQNLQSDLRFCESYARARLRRGDGPVKIHHKLKERGVDAALIAETLSVFAAQWCEGAVDARAKRFGVEIPTDFKEKARQSRFLERRGFSIEQIRAALKN